MIFHCIHIDQHLPSGPPQTSGIIRAAPCTLGRAGGPITDKRSDECLWPCVLVLRFACPFSTNEIERGFLNQGAPGPHQKKLRSANVITAKPLPTVFLSATSTIGLVSFVS